MLVLMIHLFIMIKAIQIEQLQMNKIRKIKITLHYNLMRHLKTAGIVVTPQSTLLNLITHRIPLSQNQLIKIPILPR
jgi:hypothetical protein